MSVAESRSKLEEKRRQREAKDDMILAKLQHHIPPPFYYVSNRWIILPSITVNTIYMTNLELSTISNELQTET